MTAPVLPLRFASPGRAVVAAAVLGAAAALVVLSLTTPVAAPASALPDAGPGVPLLATGARLTARVCAVVVVGGLLVPAWLLRAAPAPERVLRAVRVAAWAWVAACLLGMLGAAAEALAVPLPGAFTAARVWAFVPSLEGGRALMVTAALAAVVAGGSRLVRSPAETLALLGVAVLAVLPTSLTGHVATSELHVPVSVGTAVHVVAALLWVGGLVGLGLVGRAPTLADAVGRFSGLALVAAVLVTVSGLLSAWWRLGAVGDAWRTTYGALVLAKVALLVVLLALGAVHRRASIPALRRGSSRVWWRLAGVETALMGAALGAAVALGRTPTPTRPDVVALPHGGVTTVDRALPAPTPWRLLLEPRASATGVVAVVLLVLVVVLAASRPGVGRGAAGRGSPPAWARPWCSGGSCWAARALTAARCSPSTGCGSSRPRSSSRRCSSSRPTTCSPGPSRAARAAPSTPCCRSSSSSGSCWAARCSGCRWRGSRWGRRSWRARRSPACPRRCCVSAATGAGPPGSSSRSASCCSSSS